jgi:hypothetical protein
VSLLLWRHLDRSLSARSGNNKQGWGGGGADQGS